MSQLDLFGFEPPHSKPQTKVILKPIEAIKPDLDVIVQKALKRLENAEKPSSEQLLRDWVFSYDKYGLSSRYHVMAYNIGLLKTLKVNDEIILNALLWN